MFGSFVLAQLVYKLIYPAVPAFQTMGVVGVAVLVANGVCFALLLSHCAEDINMRSVWLCSRNDLLANTSVLFAAWAVWVTASPVAGFHRGSAHLRRVPAFRFRRGPRSARRATHDNRSRVTHALVELFEPIQGLSIIIN